MSAHPLFAALFCGLLCIAAQSASGQKPTKVLRVVPSADVAETDPARAANQIGRIYSQMVFDTLFALVPTLQEA